MNFEEAIDWLYGFQRFGVKLGLERISYICDKLGNPQNNYKIIHVGGTNGKGSVCRILESILTSNGYNVGLYTSPHLQRFSERLIVNNEEISKSDIANLAEKLKPIINDMVKNGKTPTFFEIVTGMTFQYFSEKEVDFSIIEVGLGGRFDATNIVNPLLTVITNVSLEHQHVLGRYIKDIAYEKAGIIKNNVPVVTAANADALKIIKKICKEKNADINTIHNNSWKRLNNNINYQEFSIKGFLKDYIVRTKMLGEYQGENIALSLFAIENLQLNGVYITEKSIIDGFLKTFNPGRMEIVSNNPMIILDGAHNPMGIKMLAESLKKDLVYQKLLLVIGILSDKNIKEMLKIIVPMAFMIIVTKPDNKRACNQSDLKKMIHDFELKKEVVVKDRISNAVEFAKSMAKKDDLILVTGSLFTVGEAREYLI
jgi:dihydrofolate synthase/folylpolyglutamate synthase